MALSNMLREPRREIIETVVGIMAFSVFLLFDTFFARWFQAVTTDSNGGRNGCPIPIAYLLGVLAFMALIGIVFFIHFLGEELCDFLDDHGLELRPNPRENRR
jgi:hypothetical protein